MLFNETVCVCFEKNMEHTGTLFEPNAEFCYVKEDGAYSNH
jgi:hypothetical protein